MSKINRNEMRPLTTTEGSLSPSVVKSKLSVLVNLMAFFPLDSFVIFERSRRREEWGAGAPQAFLWDLGRAAGAPKAPL